MITIVINSLVKKADKANKVVVLDKKDYEEVVNDPFITHYQTW